MGNHAVLVTNNKTNAGPEQGHPDASQTKGRRSKMGRALSRSALAALAAGVGLAATAAGGAPAYADTLTNGPTIMLGDYPIPASAPAYMPDAGLLPGSNPGALGNGANIFMTGSASYGTNNDSYAIGIPNGSPNWGTQVTTAPYTGATAPQTWYFQQVGFVGLNTEWSSPQLLLAPVYRILNYNDGTYTCLDGYGNDPTVGSIVDSYGCNPNQVNQTNQLWVVSSPKQFDEAITTSGTLWPGGLGQEFSGYLQDVEGTGLQDSVIENVATLAANGWNATTAPVLSAAYSDVAGINSGLTLQNQTFPVQTMNSTWNIAPAFTPPPSSPSDPNPCAGLNGYSLLICTG